MARTNGITRRTLLIGAGVAAGAAIGATLVERALHHAPEGASAGPPYGIDNWPGLDWHLFSETSPWVAPLDKTSVDPRSDVYISSLVSDGPPAPAGSKQLFGWGFPLYFGRVTDPLYRIVLRETRFTYGQHIDGHRIHAPSGMQPSDLSDGVVYVIDQVDGYTYRFRLSVVDVEVMSISSCLGFRFVS